MEKLFNLTPDEVEAEIFISTVKENARSFGYDFLVKNIPGLRVETVTTNKQGTDTTTFTCSKHINLLEAFSPDNLDTCRKAARLTYVDKSFELKDNQELQALEGA